MNFDDYFKKLGENNKKQEETNKCYQSIFENEIFSALEEIGLKELRDYLQKIKPKIDEMELISTFSRSNNDYGTDLLLLAAIRNYFFGYKSKLKDENKLASNAKTFFGKLLLLLKYALVDEDKNLFAKEYPKLKDEESKHLEEIFGLEIYTKVIYEYSFVNLVTYLITRQFYEDEDYINSYYYFKFIDHRGLGAMFCGFDIADDFCILEEIIPKLGNIVEYQEKLEDHVDKMNKDSFEFVVLPALEKTKEEYPLFKENINRLIDAYKREDAKGYLVDLREICEAIVIEDLKEIFLKISPNLRDYNDFKIGEPTYTSCVSQFRNILRNYEITGINVNELYTSLDGIYFIKNKINKAPHHNPSWNKGKKNILGYTQILLEILKDVNSLKSSNISASKKDKKDFK